jgi:ABC-type branched-subunit amino acid transport system substrate-binding protein
MRRFRGRPEGLMVAALCAAAMTLVGAAVIGGRQTEASLSAAAISGPSAAEAATDQPDARTDSQATSAPSQAPGTRAVTAGATAATKPGAQVERPSAAGATRIGVFNDHVEVGVHAPITFDGVPLNLAEDPVTGVKGYVTYINRHGGINGLKVRLIPEDDRYTTAGARQAADRLTKEAKPFLIEGALGIDQIHKVAIAAKAGGFPYIAGGGPEPEFARITDMYQNISNYDQYLETVVQFICRYGAKYVGGTKASDIRLGTTTLNSEFILPVEKRFVAKVTERGCVRTPVDRRARGSINKPTEQTTYGGQMIDLRSSYNNQGANLVVPLQDPVSTSRQVLEWSKSGYHPKWTIANFAHDSDTALALFQGEWAGMRVMSGACYYHPQGGGRPYDPKLCAQMGEAHRQWVSLGHVDYDQNAGGSFGGKSSYDYNEESWTADGGGGAAGYQLVYFWHGALKSIGADPTREKFLAALNAYDNYSNVLTGPISFAGSPNRMIGATKFVLLEGQANLKYRQVAEITPGLADHF